MNLTMPPAAETVLGLTARLRQETALAHHSVERSTLVQLLLHGELDLATYVLLLRNLHALYLCLEQGLRRYSATPWSSAFDLQTLERAPALAADLHCLHGPDWASLPVTAALEAYVDQIKRRVDQDPLMLLAHAYVRYFGDLSGGQALRRVVKRMLPDDNAGLAFYTFIQDPRELKRTLAQALDALSLDAERIQALSSEAQQAFAAHEDLFAELAQ